MPGAGPKHRLTEIGDGAARRLRQAGDEPQQGRLAGSGAAQQADDLALHDLKLDAVEHYKFAAVRLGEGVTQTVDVEESSAHGGGTHGSGTHVRSTHGNGTLGDASAEPEFAFGVEIQRTPEHAIDDDDVKAHHGNTQHDAVEITGIGLLRNIGAEAFGFEMLIAP